MDVDLVRVEKLHSIYHGFSPVNIFGNLSSLYLKSHFYKNNKHFLNVVEKIGFFPQFYH